VKINSNANMPVIQKGIKFQKKTDTGGIPQITDSFSAETGKKADSLEADVLSKFITDMRKETPKEFDDAAWKRAVDDYIYKWHEEIPGEKKEVIPAPLEEDEWARGMREFREKYD